MTDLQATRRVIAPLIPTEEPGTLRRTSRPVVKETDLALGVRLVGIEADHFRGMWYAILDVTAADDSLVSQVWAPGIQPIVLIPQASYEAIKAAQDTQEATSGSSPAPSPLILPEGYEPASRSGLTLLR